MGREIAHPGEDGADAPGRNAFAGYAIGFVRGPDVPRKEVLLSDVTLFDFAYR